MPETLREVSPAAGHLPDPANLIDVGELRDAYYDRKPDPSVVEQRVAFGTSGHRGSSLQSTFNEDHVLAISEAIVRYRSAQGIDGPLFIGRDTHALSELAFRTALEVLCARGVEVMIDADGGYTPTPVISHQILAHNRARDRSHADGIVVTPSHNPPDDGGVKYNPPSGGPAPTDVTSWIEDEANRLLSDGPETIRRVPYEQALQAASTHRCDYVSAYVDDLPAVIDIDLIREAGIRLGADPLGGASVAYWQAIADRHRLELEIVNDMIDPTFRFIPCDWDGKVRMDCSSPYAMARLTELRDRFDVAFANDPDADRHGIVTPSAGLLNPNHFLSVCVGYLFGPDRAWAADVEVGKTVVSSSMIDRVASERERHVVEVPVGFKWFVDGLLAGRLGFGGEESAGASFLRRDGTVWTTDKDGLIACLLAAEMTARTGSDPGKIYRGITDRLGSAEYQRVDVATTPSEKAALARLSADQVAAESLAGEPIQAVLSTAPGNGAPIGGVKVVAEHGWFAARPSGTEDVYKVYAESFLGEEHLERILTDAQVVVQGALGAARG